MLGLIKEPPSYREININIREITTMGDKEENEILIKIKMF